MKTIACAIYTRKSSEEGLEQGFNSLDAQREACEAFVLSQKAQGWRVRSDAYDDGGFSGGNLERPGMQRLLADVALGKVQVIVVYKVDRLTRSLADFAQLVERFDAQGVSFVSVTQQFNTASSMGRLTLNVLLSFAQFEREVTGERIRDKIAASKRKGIWMGGTPPIGYRAHERTLVADPDQAPRVDAIYRLYLELGCVRRLQQQLKADGWSTAPRGEGGGSREFSRGHLYRILSNPVYVGRIVHKEAVYDGQHPAIVDVGLWDDVQQTLKANRTGHRTRVNVASPSLLAGMVFDGKGRRLMPSHTSKGSRRYRYYVTQSETGEDNLRVPAQELEAAVIRALQNWMHDESEVLPFIGDDATVIRSRLAHAKRFGDALDQRPDLELWQRFVRHVIVEPRQLAISFRPAALWMGEEQDLATMHVPADLKRCGMAMRLVVHGAGKSRTPNARLIALVRKARTWFHAMAHGEVKSNEELAIRERVSGQYVSRVIQLAFLAPDIVNAIERGEQPDGLTVETLQRQVPLPMRWSDQRKVLGLTPGD